ncbi:RNA polymerase sigma factor [Brevundimonas sp. R86498]|uniref:RNA polymerase sigma factor n=1 Tax=Brevundimonas sp. R86498 TaxID=3093845 RepID=UPI0037C6D8B3
MSPEALVAELRRELIVWLTRKGGAATDVEDVVQDAFLRFHRAGYQLGAPDARPLLFVIARNLQKDRWKAEGRDARRRTDDDVHALDRGPHALASETSQADDRLIQRQNLAAAAAIIRALPPRCRDAFLLHRFEALTYRQIAARLGVSVSMVEKYVAEALRQLKKTREG